MCLTTPRRIATFQCIPMILVGESFWKPLEKFFEEVLVTEGMIDKEDTDLYTITDDEETILNIIKNAPVRLDLKYTKKS